LPNCYRLHQEHELPSRQPFTLRVTRRMAPFRFSIGFVVESVRSSHSGRLQVLERGRLVKPLPQRLSRVRWSVPAERRASASASAPALSTSFVRIAHRFGDARLQRLRQIAEHVAQLVFLATLTIARRPKISRSAFAHCLTRSFESHLRYCSRLRGAAGVSMIERVLSPGRLAVGRKAVAAAPAAIARPLRRSTAPTTHSNLRAAPLK
jgi:hypothetical protein